MAPAPSATHSRHLPYLRDSRALRAKTAFETRTVRSSEVKLESGTACRVAVGPLLQLPTVRGCLSGRQLPLRSESWIFLTLGVPLSRREEVATQTDTGLYFGLSEARLMSNPQQCRWHALEALFIRSFYATAHLQRMQRMTDPDSFVAA